MACGQELCPNWSGDGRVCPCAVLDLPDWDDSDEPDADDEGTRQEGLINVEDR